MKSLVKFESMTLGLEFWENYEDVQCLPVFKKRKQCLLMLAIRVFNLMFFSHNSAMTSSRARFSEPGHCRVLGQGYGALRGPCGLQCDRFGYIVQFTSFDMQIIMYFHRLLESRSAG